jgi:23S rRNA pseudouridine955/2504/2580 synthase
MSIADVRIISVSEDEDGQRLDRWIKRHAPDLPYVLVQKLLRKGQIRVSGKRAKPETRLEIGQEVRLPPRGDNQSAAAALRSVTLSDKDKALIKSLVIYDDGEILAINKPHGMAVQGGTKTTQHIDGMLEALADKKGVKPRLVHRLDKDTSGVLLLARSAKTATALGNLFKGRDIRKIYWALVSPVPEIYDGTIKVPLIKAGGSNKERMRVDFEEGKQAITEYKVLDIAGSDAAFIAFWPRTGRTHQIRAHAEYMGCPILGDRKYARREIEHEHEQIDLDSLNLSKRLHLHAQRVIFASPLTGKIIDISAPLPPELVKSWKALGFSSKMRDDPFEMLKV